MTFLEFLKGFDGGWVVDDGFLRMALTDPQFPDFQDWPRLATHLVVHDADAKVREEARWFWEQYEDR